MDKNLEEQQKSQLINSPDGLENRMDVDTNTQLICFMD